MRRRLLWPVVVAMLAGCSAKEEGRSCAVQGDCPPGQGCGFGGTCSKAAALCQDCVRGDARCSTSLDVCVAVKDDPCGRWSADPCGGHGSCDSPEPRRAVCKCDPAGPCEGATGAKVGCSALGVTRYACAMDLQCPYQVSTASCNASEICVVSASQDSTSCNPRWVIALTSPPADTLVATPGVQVRATVTLGSVAVAPPATIDLRAGSTSVGLFQNPQVSNLTATYGAVTYLPGADLEQSVDLEAVATPPNGVEVKSLVRRVLVDTLAPRIAPTVECGAKATCLRDDVLVVSATVADAHPGAVVASLSLDGHGSTTPLAGGTATLPLAGKPFPFFAHAVDVRIDAVDALGNSTSVTRQVDVSRLRAAYDPGVGVPTTSPAVISPALGTLVVGVGSTAAQLRGIAPDGSEAWARTLEIPTTPSPSRAPVKAAPAVGLVNIYVSGEDGRIYRAQLDGTLLAGGSARCPTSANVALFAGPMPTPALRTEAGASVIDHAYGAGRKGFLVQCYSDDTISNPSLGEPVNAPGVFYRGGLFVASAGAAGVTVRRFDDLAAGPVQNGSVALVDAAAPPNACDDVVVPLAVDGTGKVLVACNNGQLHRVTSAGAAAVSLSDEYLGTLPAAPSGSPVVLSTGAVLVPLASGKIARLSASGLGTFADLGAADRANGLAVTGTGAENTVLATTSQGNVVAFDPAGGVRWSGSAASGAALDFPVVVPAPSAAPATALPTLFAGSAGGKVVRVVVDDRMDRASPWPKAQHDLRNTGNADAPLP